MTEVSASNIQGICHNIYRLSYLFRKILSVYIFTFFHGTSTFLLPPLCSCDSRHAVLSNLPQGVSLRTTTYSEDKSNNIKIVTFFII